MSLVLFQSKDGLVQSSMERDDHDDWGPHDVRVQIGVGEEDEFIHLHKSVLIKHSGFFAALLSKRWPKGKCSDGMPLIILGVKDDREAVTPAKGPAPDMAAKNVAASSSKDVSSPAESKQDASTSAAPANDDAASTGEGDGENDEKIDEDSGDENEEENEEEEEESEYYRGVLRARYNAYSIALDLMYYENYKAVIDTVAIALDLLEVAAELQYDALIEYCCTFLEASRWSEDELVRIQDAIRPLQLPAAKELLQRAEPVSGSNCIETLKVAFLSALEQDKDYLRGTFHKLLSTAVSELGDELLVASFLDVVTAKIDGALAEVATGLAMPSAGSGPSARRRTFLKYHVEKALWIMGVLREMGAIPEIVFAWSKCRSWLPKAIPETECKRLVGQFSLEVLEGLVGPEKGAIACASMSTLGLRPPQLRSALVDMIAMSWGLINDALASEADNSPQYDKTTEIAKRKVQKNKFRELLQTLPDANELLTKWFQEKSYAQLVKSVDLSPSFEVFCRRVRAGKRKLQEAG